jgi:nucleotide-binding universal stress UspA family protein
MAELTKMIVVPVDGSQDALRSVDYLNLIFGAEHNAEVILFYVLPTLPSALVDDREVRRESRLQLKAVEDKNVRMAERILAEAKKALVQKGFDERRVKTVYRNKEIGIARDICSWADDKQADAIVISSRGRSRLVAFFMGEICRKLLEYCRVCPVWIVTGAVKSKRVLVGVDSSENALRAVDHAGFMFSGTDCEVTLFHTMRNLRRFVPKEVLQEAPELEELWKQKAGQEIGPYVKKAREVLLKAGLSESQVGTRVVDGSRSAAGDILKEAKSSGCGTLVLGRRGQSGVKEFSLGSVAGKALEAAANMTVAVVP